MATKVIKGMAVSTDSVSGVPCDTLGGPRPLELVLAFLIHFQVTKTLYHPAGGWGGLGPGVPVCPHHPTPYTISFYFPFGFSRQGLYV